MASLRSRLGHGPPQALSPLHSPSSSQLLLPLPSPVQFRRPRYLLSGFFRSTLNLLKRLPSPSLSSLSVLFLSVISWQQLAPCLSLCFRDNGNTARAQNT